MTKAVAAPAFSTVLLLALCTLSQAQPAIDSETEKAIQDSLSTNFTLAALISGDEVIKLGLWDFDPNEYLDSNDDALGSPDSTELRQSLTAFTIPFSWKVSESDSDNELWLDVHASYLELKSKGYLTVDTSGEEDRINQQILTLGFGVKYLHPFDEHWELELGSNAKWMQYHNSTDFNSSASRSIATVANGVSVNYDVSLLMSETFAGINYNWLMGESRYQAFSKFHYLRGKSLDADIDAHDIEPEAWYLSTGISTIFPIYRAGHNVDLQLSRIDVGGDLPRALGTHYYYQASAIWLVDVNSGDADSLLENIGIGLNLTYGSTLKGGTIVLVYNFDKL